MKKQGEPLEGWAWIVTLFGVLFLASVDNQLLIPLIPRLSQEFSVSVQALGGLFSIYALSAALFNLLLGPMTDRYGRVRFIWFGLGGMVATSYWTAQASSYEELFLLRAVTGLLAGLLSTCTASFVGDFVAYERRGKVMGVILSSYFAALIFGIPLSSWVSEEFGWRNVYLGGAALSAFLLLLGFVALPRDHRSGGGSWRASFSTFRVLLSKRVMVAALLTSFLISGGTLAFLTYISGYLDSEFGLRPFEISLVFMVSGVAAILASPFSGWLSDRWTKRAVFLASNTLLAAPLLAIVSMGGGALLLGGVFLISLCISFRQTSLQTLQTELIPWEERGSFIALRNCFSQLGIAFSVLVAGELYTDFGYLGVTILAALLTVIGSAILFWFVPEPDRS